MSGAVRRNRRATWGVQREYVDAARARRRVSAEHARAVEACMRPVDEAGIVPAFVPPGARLPSGVGGIEREDGGELPGGSVLSRDAPFGYHRLVLRDGRRSRTGPFRM